MKVFWSWQSDTPGATGRHLVKSALEEAISELRLAENIEEPIRSELHLDSDRQGVPGSPDLARLILEKIDGSAVFIADVTAVGEVISSKTSGQPKKLINSNVAIELGYAMRTLGPPGILMVMNEHYGGRKDLPFDLLAKAGPILFNLPPDAATELKRIEKSKLKSHLRSALQLCIQEAAKTKETARQIENESSATAVTSLDWEKLGNRLGQSCKFLRADSQRGKGEASETWRIAGGSNAMCEALLKKAGAMLIKSPRVSAKLPQIVRDEPQELVRWLLFLKFKGYHKADHLYNYVDESGNQSYGGILGSISDLAFCSSVVCEECSSDEL